VQGAKVVDVLNRIVKNQSSKRAPTSRKMNGKQKRQAGCPPLSAAEDEAGIQAISNFQTQHPAHITPQSIPNIRPIDMRAKSLI
jgi:hypothetical protein